MHGEQYSRARATTAFTREATPSVRNILFLIYLLAQRIYPARSEGIESCDKLACAEDWYVSIWHQPCETRVNADRLARGFFWPRLLLLHSSEWRTRTYFVVLLAMYLMQMGEFRSPLDHDCGVSNGMYCLIRSTPISVT